MGNETAKILAGLVAVLRPISTQETKHEIGPDRNKIEPARVCANFLFQFEPVIRSPDDKELKYFELFLADCVDNTRWKKVLSDPILIFLSGPVYLTKRADQNSFVLQTLRISWFRSAEASYKQTLAINENILGKEHPLVAKVEHCRVFLL